MAVASPLYTTGSLEVPLSSTSARRRGAQILGAVLAVLLIGPLLASSPAGANESADLNQDGIDQMVVELNQTDDPAVMADVLPDALVAEMPAQIDADFTMAPAAEETQYVDEQAGEQPAAAPSTAASSSWAPCSPPGQGGRQCPLPGYPQPYGLLPSNPRNDFGMPDLPIPGGNYCTSAPDRIPFLSDFRSACYQHDLAYVFTPVSRADADRRFLDNMKRGCRDKHGWWNPLRYVCYGVAYIYYFAVRLFGGSRFGTTLIPGFNAEYVPPPPPPPPPDPVDPPDPCGYDPRGYDQSVRQEYFEYQRPNCP